jgi:hypothetical protein
MDVCSHSFHTPFDFAAPLSAGSVRFSSLTPRCGARDGKPLRITDQVQAKGE